MKSTPHRSDAGTLACLFVASLFLALTSNAQVNDVRLPITVDADSTNYDGKNSMLTFEGLRITQGNIGIQADKGRASKLDFEDSVWQFAGNVIIDTDQGHIECESADLEFNQHELRFATIVGTPATFELRRTGSEATTYAEAERLIYDFTAGVVEFSGNAVITEDGNQISSSFLVYNIEEQRINARSSGEGESRVKMIYTPRASVDTVGKSPFDEPTDGQDPGADDPPEDND